MHEFLKKLLPPTGIEEEEPLSPVNAEGPTSWAIPDRYRVKKIDETSVLTCLESPNIIVRLQKGKVVAAQAARKSPERTIFLDGAAGGEPFMDHERQVYNLDHHEGVERSFTLATCEQALVVVRKGLSLKEKNWTIYANEPDLDTVFAIWALLNHLHLTGEQSHVLGEIVPLIRLEGMIDSLGLEHVDLLPISADVLEKTRRKLDRLREDEISLKKAGQWNDLDYTAYTLTLLKKIDNLIFRVSDFRDFRSVVEIARADIDEGDSVVAYHCDMGIYELEEYLTRLYGKKPALILLQKDRHNYTIRKSDMFSPLKLEQIYERLNLYDPAVSGWDADNRWGGSADIGGSPRGTGTALSAGRIVELCSEAFSESAPLMKARQLGRAVLTGILPQLLGWAVLAAGLFFEPFQRFLTVPFGLSTGMFAFAMALVCITLYFTEMRVGLPVYGYRLPAGLDWLKILPVPAFLAVAGGLWIPMQYRLVGGPSEWFYGVIILPLLITVLYFSGIHGRLIAYFPIQRYRGPWFLSQPALYTSVAYAIGSFLLPVETHNLFPLSRIQDGIVAHISNLPVYFLFGLSLAVIRERTESILPVWAIQTSGYLVAFFFV